MEKVRRIKLSIAPTGLSAEGTKMSELYDLVNVFDGDEWLGQFMDIDTAKAWIKKKGYDISKLEISQRRPERKTS